MSDRVSVPALDTAVAPTYQRRATQVSFAIGQVVSAVSMWLSATLIVVSVGVVVIRVFFRYVINTDLTWANDLLALIFVWIVFLGIPRAIWRDSSPRLGVSRRLAKRVPAVAELLSGGQAVIEIAFFAYVLAAALKLLPTSGETGIPSLGVSQVWATASVIVGSVLVLVTATARVMNRPVSAFTALGGLLTGVLSAVLFAYPLGPYIAAVVGILGALLLDAPIAVALGLGGAAMVAGGQPYQLPTVAAQLLEGPGNLALLAIPLFMLMGALIAQSRLASDLSRFVRAVLGWLPGGVGVASIATGGLFANMSGSAVADSAAIATVYTPQLREVGYKAEEAAALQSNAGVVGVVFPPAIAMILYGTVANLDVIGVFKAVIVPGLLLVAVMMAITVAHAARSPYHLRTRFAPLELVRSIPAALPVLIIPVVLDGGIFSGVFTPAESGAVAVAVALILVLALRGLTLKQARAALVQAVDGTTLVMFILIAVTVLDYGFTTSGLQQHITSLLSLAGDNAIAYLIIVNILFLFIHEFVETAPSILVLVPLIIPAALTAGVNPYQLGAVIAINSTIGLVLPPVGVSLYVASQIAGVDPLRALRHVWKYIAGSFCCLILVTAFPFFSTWLPAHW